MSIGTKLYTFLKGKKVGEDDFGNAYYEERSAKSGAEAKRWVLYKGIPEPSKVPAEWHRWLHYTASDSPAKKPSRHYFWEKPHLPNLSGTKFSYSPSGHAKRGGNRREVESDYTVWQPDTEKK